MVDSYQNLGIIQVSGYLNMRESASRNADIIGKLLGDSACEIVDDSVEGWYQVSSGGLTGYISSEFVLRGDEARARAMELVAPRAVVTVDALNIRTEPSTDADVVGQALRNERYIVEEETADGWLKIQTGYISKDYVEIRYALNEARKLDMRSMVLNLYENIGISSVDSYLNVREEPSEDGKIIGKMTSKSAGEILEKSEDGTWYKIHSGPVTGYVKAEYILTGDAARAEALEVAVEIAKQVGKRIATVTTETLYVRAEASTECDIIGMVPQAADLLVMEETEGWVKVDIEEGQGWISTEYVSLHSEFVQAESREEEERRLAKEEEERRKAQAAAAAAQAAQAAANASTTQEEITYAVSGGSEMGQAVANYALQFVGNPYVYGGTSLTNGADCSGFVMSVYANFGVSLPHSDAGDRTQGYGVDGLANAQPGDIVCYSGHVGIYIGGGQIVHASSSRTGIIVSNAGYREILAIRRIF